MKLNSASSASLARSTEHGGSSYAFESMVDLHSENHEPEEGVSLYDHVV